jgi:hypothetical protein
METISKIKQKSTPVYDVCIDFDEASIAWTSNKKYIGNGSYKYVCPVEKNDIKCGKVCYKLGEFCWQHRNWNK